MNYLLKNRIYSNIEEKFEFYIRFSFLIFSMLALYYFNLIPIFFKYWIIPLITTANWIGSFIELSEHYPLLMRKIKKDIYLSRNRLTSSLENFFIGVHQENFHLVHHLFPKVPFWNFWKVHEILMKDSVYLTLHRNQKPGISGIIYDVLNEPDENNNS